MLSSIPPPAITSTLDSFLSEASSLKARLAQLEGNLRGKRTVAEVGTRLFVPRGSKGLARWAAQAVTDGSYRAALARLESDFAGLLDRVHRFLGGVSHAGPGYGLAAAGARGNSHRLQAKLKRVREAKRLPTKVDRLITVLEGLRGEPLMPNSEVAAWLERQRLGRQGRLQGRATAKGASSRGAKGAQAAKGRAGAGGPVTAEPDPKVWRALTDIVHDLNFNWQAKFGKQTGPLLTDDSKALQEIAKGCRSAEEFTHRIAALNTFVDGLRRPAMEAAVRGKGLKLPQRQGTINALEDTLKLINPGYDFQLISDLRLLRVLRSKRRPIHSDDPQKLQAALRELGFEQPPVEGDPVSWQELWTVARQRFLLVLQRLNGVL